jgi:general secretion pathway protein J
MTRTRRRGFTLVEVIIALSIAATLLVVMFAGLRVGLAAWRRGDERAEALQRERSITEILTSTLAATHPYQVPATGREPAHLLFEGEPDRVAFVTAAAPFPAAQPIAYTAVTLSQDAGSGLAVRQKALPNDKPFERLPPTVVDATVTTVAFRYLRDSDRAWTRRWDMAAEKALPVAIEVTLTIARGARAVERPPLIISLPVTAP